MTPEDLDPHDRLTYLIGRVVQQSVMLEHFLRTLWRDLAAGYDGLAGELLPSNVSTLIEDCRHMLSTSPFPAGLRAAGEEVLLLAKAANDARNEHAHRYWHRNRDGSEVDPKTFVTWRLQKRRVGIDDSRLHIEDVETNVADLGAAMVRIGALAYALYPIGVPPRTRAEMAAWEASEDVMRLVTGEIFELRGPASDPDG